MTLIDQNRSRSPAGNSRYAVGNPNADRRNPSVQLALNGTPVYLYDILMTVSVKREEKDMTGQKSGTKKSNKGVKAKELNVTGKIPYNRREWLSTLFKLAEAEDGKGQQVKYRVACISAEAVNMREAQFSDTVQAAEMEELLAWSISFTLKEINSVAEKKDQRRKKPQPKVQGEAAPAATSTAQSAVENTAKLQAEDNSLSAIIDKTIGNARGNN